MIRALIYLLVLLMACPAWATTRYVSQSGNDANSCATSANIATPKLTFASAIACLAAGDTLYIRAGTWTTALNLSAKTGTAGNYITVAAYPGDPVGSVIIQPTTVGGFILGLRNNIGFFIIDGFVADGINAPLQSGNNLDTGTHDWIFQNLEVKNWSDDGFDLGSAGGGHAVNITVQNCHIHDQRAVDIVGQRYYGLYVALCDNCLIQDNEIDHNGGGGMQIYPGPESGVTVRRNKIHHNGSLSTTNVGGIIVGTSPVSNVKIYNNLIYSNGIPGSLSNFQNPGIYVFSNATGVVIAYNTIWDNYEYGIYVEASTATGLTIQDNIAFGTRTSGSPNGVSLPPGNITINASSTGNTIDHNLTTNPLFVNAGAGNFQLQAGSAAINTGTPISGITTDYLGVTRPQGSAEDIGAYEFTNGINLSTPTGLAVH